MKPSKYTIFIIITTAITLLSSSTASAQEGRLRNLYDGLDLIEPYSTLTKYEAVTFGLNVDDPEKAVSMIAEEYDGLDDAFDQQGIAELDEKTSITLGTYLVYELWEEHIREQYKPGEKQLLEILQTKEGSPFEFESDWIDCARILVPNDVEDPKKKADDLYQRIKLGEDFTVVAKDYYRTIGQDYDGALGLIQKESGVRPQFFNQFWSRNPGEVFGPVKDKNGWLIGKLVDKGEAGYRPVQQIEKRLQNEYFADVLPQKKQELINEFKSNNRLDILIDIDNWPSVSTPPDADLELFKVDGEVIIWSDVNMLTPMIWGDVENPDYPPIITEKAMFRAVLNNSNIAKKLRQSKSYRNLSKILEIEGRIVEQLNRDQGELDLSDQKLQEYYQTSETESHFQPPQVRCVGIIINRSMESRSMRARRDVDLKKWETISQIYEHVQTFQSPKDAWWEEYSLTEDSIVYQNAVDWLPVDRIHYFLGPHSLELKPGENTGLIIGDRHYGVLFLLDRKKRDKIPYQEIQSQIKNDYLIHWRENGRKELLSINTSQ